MTGADGFVALLVQRGASPRARPIAALANASIPGLMTPLAHGVGRGPPGAFGSALDCYVVCRAPGGGALGTADGIVRAWGEAELLSCVLRPVAAALAELQARGLTHRAIRPDNVFQTRPGAPVTLGAAWAAPPASLQPPVFEPPYAAVCLSFRAGDGSVADDVYALGVLLLALAAGRMPMAGLDDAEQVRRKLDAGSYGAITAGMRPPRGVADLARGMLAEDPDHRPSLAQLANPEAARSRRVAARPARTAQRPLEIAGRPTWHARGLAAAMMTAPGAAVRSLRSGVVEQWLRRNLSDAPLAAQIEGVSVPAPLMAAAAAS